MDEAREVIYGEEDFEDQLINRERGVQRQWEDCKIHKARYNERYKARYNERYKEIETNDRILEYLGKENLGKGKKEEKVKALFKLKCRNLEQGNKYWVQEHKKKCIFCGKGKDNLKHYVEECSEIRKNFIKLGKDKEKILRKLYDEELDEMKREIIRILRKEREVAKRIREMKELKEDREEMYK